jgi:hypothetical protein
MNECFMLDLFFFFFFFLILILILFLILFFFFFFLFIFYFVLFSPLHLALDARGAGAHVDAHAQHLDRFVAHIAAVAKQLLRGRAASAVRVRRVKARVVVPGHNQLDRVRQRAQPRIKLFHLQRKRRKKMKLKKE